MCSNSRRAGRVARAATPRMRQFGYYDDEDDFEEQERPKRKAKKGVQLDGLLLTGVNAQLKTLLPGSPEMARQEEIVASFVELVDAVGRPLGEERLAWTD